MEKQIKIQSNITCKAGNSQYIFKSNELLLNVYPKPKVSEYIPPKKLVFEEIFSPCNKPKTCNLLNRLFLLFLIR